MTEVASDTEQEFKRGMRRLASTITILTTAAGDDWFGMAATSVCSVSASPPTLLACISRTASMFDPTMSAGRFAVNLLRTEHHDLVGRFSGKLKGRERFDAGDWKLDDGGLPYLTDAQTTFFCTVDTSLLHADHGVFIARVDAVRIFEEITPLLYQDGKLASSRPLG